MRTSILNIIRENGTISFDDIIYELEAETQDQYNEVARVIERLQWEGIIYSEDGDEYSLA
ncbi:hypothetical protein BV283P1_00046 [Phocaeicola phage BV283P1]|nr:hypothetical protein BV283P1_00046 [Phocaeicola phage BV283P1]WAX10655.1 hypothetical protein BV283P3_00047 [Phocaeicola phage BV283P3]